MEYEPFGSVLPGPGRHLSPANRLGAAGDGAYVEFDQPAGTEAHPEKGGNCALIPCSGKFSLHGLNPKFVIVKRWWMFWMDWSK